MTTDPAAPPRLRPSQTPPAKATIQAPPPDSAVEQMLSPIEVADRLHISEQMVRKAIIRGDLFAYQIRNRVRIPESAVLAWMTPVVSAKDGQ
jgi:excisionase family DNA binding protein